MGTRFDRNSAGFLMGKWVFSEIIHGGDDL